MAQDIDYAKIAAQYGGKPIDYAAEAEKASSMAEKPHPEAMIGPLPEDAPVTLGDLIDDPKSALRRMVTLTKRGLSDPKTMIPLAVGAGIGALRGMGVGTGKPPTPPPIAGARVGLGQALREHVALDDVVGAIPGANTLKSGYRVAKGVQRAVQQAGTPAAPVPPPVEAAPAPVASPGALATPAPTIAPPEPVVAPSRPAPTPKAPRAAKKSGEESGGLPSLDEIQLTPAEIATAVKWHEQGVSPETILHRVLQSRQLTARTRTTTPDQATEAIRRRNATGRWED